MYLLGYDIGSSSVKASLVEAESGRCIASAFYPETEMPIISKQQGWAEQDPEMWWQKLKMVTKKILGSSRISNTDIKSVGISYQMHGLVLVDNTNAILRPSIIWCDSRAVDTGRKAFSDIGKNKCLASLLNSPGNFTASKLKWVMDNEPEIYNRVKKFMLPGDYIAYRLTGEINTTVSGLSEGIFWDFEKNTVSEMLLKYYGISSDLVPDIIPTFSVQGEVGRKAAEETGLAPGTKVTYRAGDQPNNALSLNVLNPGEVAATAGTSGVVYGVSDIVKYDPESRINTFVHVNHEPLKNTRLGILLCINGTGILYSWLKKQLSCSSDYNEMNTLAAGIKPGSEGIKIIPFGNGAERMLGNRNTDCLISGINFNIHNNGHLLRAAQEGIAYSIRYGMEILNETGIDVSVIRAGNANMFLSDVFRNILSSVTGTEIEIFDTDGAAGAARASGYGSGFYRSLNDAMKNLAQISRVEPDTKTQQDYNSEYIEWKTLLKNTLSNLKS